MKQLRGFDVAALAYVGILTILVAVARPPGTWIYLAGHAAAAGVVVGVAAAHARWGGRWWTIARYWYIVPFILCAFREIHFLAPVVHNFDDHYYDQVLGKLDQRLFGDVDAFFLGLLNPVAADVLHLCYWSYYVSLALLGGMLHRRRDWARLNEYCSVVLTALLISYLGYFVVPALGPHVFYAQRPAAIDGWMIGGWMHRTITALELRMPDAFPSGHTLMSLVLVWLARRHASRRAFWIVVPLSAGCILATMALRYHYVVDVLASFALFPGALWLGLRLDRWRTGGVNVLIRSER